MRKTVNTLLAVILTAATVLSGMTYPVQAYTVDGAYEEAFEDTDAEDADEFAADLDADDADADAADTDAEADKADIDDEADSDADSVSDPDAASGPEDAVTSDKDAETCYTVTYKSDEDDAYDLPEDENTYREGDTFTVSSQEPGLDGCRFLGWSLTGDPSDIYTGGYELTVTGDTVLTAVWESDNERAYVPDDDDDGDTFASLSEREQQICNAIDNYVRSLDGEYQYAYYVNGVWMSETCCAFADYVWEGVFGHSRRQKPSMCTMYDSDGKLDAAGIVSFLDSHGAGTGDIIWCHDPKSANNYNITHYMILLDYDSDSITLSDGHGVNGEGAVWADHETISWAAKSREKYFNGSCYVRLYHLADTETATGYTNGPIDPVPVPQPEEGEYTGKCGDNLIWKLKKYNNSSYDLTISGYGMMDDYSMYNSPWAKKLEEISKSIHSIEIKEGVESIGDYAFSEYTPSAALTLPSSVKRIGAYAFSSSNFTGQLDLSNVTRIGKCAFQNTQFTSVVFGAGLEEIPEECFNNCCSLAGDIIIPDGIKKIGDYAFSLKQCEKDGHEQPARNISFPDSLEEIGNWAFSKNKKLAKILDGSSDLLGPNLKSVGSYAFDGCGMLSGTLTLPENVAIRTASFRDCKGLTGTLDIPGSVWDGLNHTFNSDTGTLYGHPYPYRVERHYAIPSYCFSGCSGFTKLVLHNGTEDIGKGAFYNCTGISGELNLPEQVEVQQEAFKNCTSITSINIPHRRSVIDTMNAAPEVKFCGGTFEGCTGLTGSLKLIKEDVTIYQGARLFYGTKLSSVYLEGGWSYEFEKKDDPTQAYLNGKNDIGTFCSYVSDQYETDGYEYGKDYENMPLATFPEGVTIYYDDGPYKRNGLDQTIVRKNLNDFGYTYKMYSENNIASPPLYIIDALSWDAVIPLESKSSYGLTPYRPYNVDPGELDRITITVDDPSVATIERRISRKDWEYIPHKVGKTKYTVTINTAEHGQQIAYGNIRVVKDEKASKKAVTSVSFYFDEDTMEKGKSITANLSIYPSDAADKTVTWTSDDTSVATVSSRGVVTGVGKGTAKITVTTRDGGFSASRMVTVTADSYTVFLDGNGADNAKTDGKDTMRPLDCDKGKKYTLPKNVYVRAGYEFDGWCSASDEDDEGMGIRLADKAAFTDLVLKPDDADEDKDYSITLYAKWRPDRSYTMVYDGNQKNAYGAEVRGVMKSTEGLAYGDGVIINDCIYTAEGCVFDGWNTKPDGSGKKVTLEQIRGCAALSLKDDLGVAELAKAGVGKVVLYAQWKPVVYKAAFDLNDDPANDAQFVSKTFGNTTLGSAEGAEANEAFFTFGTAVNPLPVASRKGYVFGGWFTQNGTAAVKSVPKNQAGDVTYYAKWMPWSYTVSYDANKTQGGGKFTVSGSAKKTTAHYGEELKLGECGFVNKGYRLVGWSTVKDAAAADEKLTIAKIGEDGALEWSEVKDAITLSKDKDSVKFYAVWEAVENYSVAYELNGGSKNEGENNVYPSQYKYGEGFTKSLPEPVREGYEFEGWYTDALFKKSIKKIDDKSYGDMTLYAKWSAPYRIVLHDDSGSSGGPKTYTGYTFNKEKALPAVPFRRNDAFFMGWKLKDGVNIKYTDKQKIKDPELKVEEGVLTLHLYAAWKDSFTITLDKCGGEYVPGEKDIIPATYTYESVAKKAIKLPAKFIKDGYKFEGWIDDSTGKKLTSISKTACRDYTIHAGFTPLEYQVAYNSNVPKGYKATGKMAAQKIVFGTENAHPLTANDFYINGLVFCGWSTDKNASVPEFADKSVFAFGKTGYQKKVTLYAVWALDQ